MQTFIIFIAFLCPLVFFHELGHYLFARFFGVKVEVFSIGFGPKIYSKIHNGTEYCISAIPLGGYVKMFGDDPFKKDEVPVDQRQFSFTHKSKLARFWIVFGGPMANFILAFCLFYGLFIGGEKVPEIKVGSIPERSVLYEIGIRAGDTLIKINGKDVMNMADIATIESETLRTIELERSGKILLIESGKKDFNFFEEFMKYPPILRQPLIVGAHEEQFALSFENDKVDFNQPIDLFLNSEKEKKIFLHKLDKNLKNIDIEGEFAGSKELRKFLKDRNYFPLDLKVKSIALNSPSEKSGVKANDIIVKYNDKEILNFEELREGIQVLDEVNLTIVRDGKFLKFKLVPEVKTLGDKKVKLLGLYSSAEFIAPKMIHTKSKGIFEAIPLTLKRTWQSTVSTFLGVKKLIVGEVSFKNVGGPLSIGKVATDSYNTSISYFFQLMALMSINLGLINLFPIPVLDGGHIMFIVLEVINRGPLSRRKMEIAQQFGLSVLLLLMFGALFNDFSKFF